MYDILSKKYEYYKSRFYNGAKVDLGTERLGVCKTSVAKCCRGLINTCKRMSMNLQSNEMFVIKPPSYKGKAVNRTNGIRGAKW